MANKKPTYGSAELDALFGDSTVPTVAPSTTPAQNKKPTYGSAELDSLFGGSQTETAPSVQDTSSIDAAVAAVAPKKKGGIGEFFKRYAGVTLSSLEDSIGSLVSSAPIAAEKAIFDTGNFLKSATTGLVGVAGGILNKGTELQDKFVDALGVPDLSGSVQKHQDFKQRYEDVLSNINKKNVDFSIGDVYTEAFDKLGRFTGNKDLQKENAVKSQANFEKWTQDFHKEFSEKTDVASQKVRDWAGITPENTRLDEKVLGALASTAPFIGLSLMGGGGISAGTLASTEAIQNADQVYSDALKKGLSEEEASQLAASNFGVDMLVGYVTDKIGIAGEVGSKFGGVDRAAAFIKNDKVRNLLTGFIKKGLLTAPPEVVQEVAQTINQNVNSGKKWSDGVGETALVTALMAPLLGGGANILETFQKEADKKPTVQEIAKTVETQSKLTQSQQEETTPVVFERKQEVTPEEKPLIEEAKKYKSPDEFIAAQGEKLFHGSKGNIIGAIKPGLSGSRGSAIYVTPDQNQAKTYGNLNNIFLDKNSKVFDLGSITKDQLKQDVISFLKKNNINFSEKDGFVFSDIGNIDLGYNISKHQFNNFLKAAGKDKFFNDLGYDIAKFGSDESQIAVYNQKAIKTETQLREIYNKAHSIDNQTNESNNNNYDVSTKTGSTTEGNKFNRRSDERGNGPTVSNEGGETTDGGREDRGTKKYSLRDNQGDIGKDFKDLPKATIASIEGIKKDYPDAPVGDIVLTPFNNDSLAAVVMRKDGTFDIHLNSNKQSKITPSVLRHELFGHVWVSSTTNQERLDLMESIKSNYLKDKEAFKSGLGISEELWGEYWKDNSAFVRNQLVTEFKKGMSTEGANNLADQAMKHARLMDEDGNFTIPSNVLDSTVFYNEVTDSLSEFLTPKNKTLPELVMGHNNLLFQEVVSFASENYYDFTEATGALGTHAKAIEGNDVKFTNNNYLKVKEEVLKKQELEAFKGFTDLTTSILEDLKGKTTVSKQYILDATNRAELKQVEKDIVRSIVEEMPDTIVVQDFADRVKAELLPIEVTHKADDYEYVVLPDELRGKVKDYVVNVYESPIKNRAGNIHFKDREVENYFGHTRIEDMKDKKTRRVIEVQSDLYQKGFLAEEANKLINRMTESEKAEYDRLESIREDGNTLEERDAAWEEMKKLRDAANERPVVINKQLAQYNDPTAHFRMVREEVKKAAEDGKTELLFPTGQTAMKIEGLGETARWHDLSNNSELLTPNTLEVGKEISGNPNARNNHKWVITDVLGDGKFKAVQKSVWDIAQDTEPYKPGGMFTEAQHNFYRDKAIKDLNNLAETFDISEKVDTSNPIYRFYEKDLGRYLKNKYGAKPITDDKGVTWYQVDVKPEEASKPVLAFRRMEPSEAQQELEIKIQVLEESLKGEPIPFLKYGMRSEFGFEESGVGLPPKAVNKLLKKNMISRGPAEAVKYSNEELRKAGLTWNDIWRLRDYIPDMNSDYSVSLTPETVNDYMINLRKRMDKLVSLKRELKDMKWKADIAYFNERQAKLKNPEFDTGNKLEDARLVLDYVQNRVQVKQAVNAVEKAKTMQTLGLDEEVQRLQKKAKDFGFTIPEYEGGGISSDKEIRQQESFIRTHPANDLVPYANRRTGLLPPFNKDSLGVYEKKMSEILKKHNWTFEEAQKVMDNYIAHHNIYLEMINDSFDPLQMVSDRGIPESVQTKTDDAAVLTPEAKDIGTIIDQQGVLPVNKIVGAHDYISTPNRVLEKIGMLPEAEFLEQKFEDYQKELPKNMQKITDWANSLPAESSEKIFDYLDNASGAVVNPIVLTAEENKVAKEIQDWLEVWAKRLKLKPHQRVSNYITHIFEEDFIKKEFDQDLARIIQDKIPSEIYDPFLEKRLGQMGYVHDAWRALDAYVKRATRKVHMDEALEKINAAAKDTTKIDIATFDLLQKYISGINMRPTKLDTLVDNSLKQLFGKLGALTDEINQKTGVKLPVMNEYSLGQRPSLKILKAGRQMVFRGTLGLNIGSAIRNLTQGVNTYAMLGEKYTAIGYAKLFNGLNQQELLDENILGMDIVQDRTISATKKFWEKFDKALFYFFEMAEKINRGAAYWGAKSKYYAENSSLVSGTRVWNEGHDEKSARKYAKKLVKNTQFTFGSIDTPIGLQSEIMKTVGQFAGFSLKQAEFLSEMAQTKNYAGMIRYAVGSFVMIITLGTLFGMDWKDVIPFYRYGVPPLVKGPYMIIRALAPGSKNKYGNVMTTKERVSLIEDAILPFIPVGVQAKKVVQGISSVVKGETQGPIESVKAISLGTKTIPDTNVSKELKTSLKTAETKLDNMNKNDVKVAKDVYSQVKGLGFGTPEADALLNDLTDEEYKAYQAVGKVEKAKKFVEDQPKIIKVVREVAGLGFGTPEADALLNEKFPETPEGDMQYELFKKISKSLYGKENDTSSAYTKQRGLVGLVFDYARAYGKDPANAWKAMTTKEKLGVVKGNLVELQRFYGKDFNEKGGSEEYKAKLLKEAGLPGGDISNYGLEHIVPVKAGGDTSPENLMLIPIDLHNSYTPFDIAASKAIKSKTKSRKEISEIAKRLKVDNTLTVEEAINMLK